MRALERAFLRYAEREDVARSPPALGLRLGDVTPFVVANVGVEPATTLAWE